MHNINYPNALGKTVSGNAQSISSNGDSRDYGPAPRVQNSLLADALVLDLNNLIERFSAVADRSHKLADRALGPDTNIVGSDDPNTGPEPLSLFGHLNAKVSMLRDIASWQETVISRLERIV